MPSSPSSAEAPIEGIGRVVSGHGRRFVVEAEDGQRVLCHTRGKKSDCVVGDRVRWCVSGDEGVIEAIEPRASLLRRADEVRSKPFAANVDRLLVVVAAEPAFSESQLARVLIAAAAAAIPARIVVNKSDLPAFDAAWTLVAPYRAIGVEVVGVALKNAPEEARRVLAPLLAGQATLALGPSGAGKSTLVNLIVPDAKAQVGDVSRALRAGRHTTTVTQWYWIDGARTSALVDSPGFREFGLRHLDAAELVPLMPDIAQHATECRFADCTHRHEPDCGVRAAVELGAIAPGRYRIYAQLFDELDAASRGC